MIWRILIIILLIFMFTGAMLNQEGGLTQDELVNATERISYDNLNLSTNMYDEGNNQNNSFIPRLIFKFADMLMFASVEGAKVGLNFGYNNPQYNFNLAWKLMFISIFAFCIIPLIYLLLFIGYGIYNLVIIIKNFIKRKNVKKKNSRS